MAVSTLNIKEYLTAFPSVVSVPNNTMTKIAELQIDTEGLYLVIRGVCWKENATGIRVINRASSGEGRADVETTNAVSSGDTFMKHIAIEHYAESDKVYLYGKQTSGTSINAYGVIKVFRLK